MKRIVISTFGLGLAVVLGCLIATPVFAWNEPDDFRGIKWGTSVHDAKLVLEQDHDKRHKKGDVMRDVGRPSCEGIFCTASVPIGDFYVRLLLEFHEGRFVGVTVDSKMAARWAEFRRIFVDRYGQPTQVQRLEYQTGGKKVTGEVLHWVGERVRIRLQQYDGNLTDMSAFIFLQSELNRRAVEKEKAVKKGKGDL